MAFGHNLTMTLSCEWVVEDKAMGDISSETDKGGSGSGPGCAIVPHCAIVAAKEEADWI